MDNEEKQEEQEKQESQDEEVKDEKEEKKGTDFVDDFGSPEANERFRRIYGHMKQYERTSQQNEKIIGQLADDMRTLIGRLDDKDKKDYEAKLDDRLSELKTKKVAALQGAEYDKAAEIDEEIISLKTAPKPEVKKVEPKKKEEEFKLPPEDEQRLVAWATEQDEEGGFKRPWANPGHPKHGRALQIGTAVMEDPEFRDRGMDVILAEVDRLMDTPKVVRKQPAVLSGESVRRDSKKIELTEDQKAVARRLYPGDPDPVKRYAEAYKKYGGARA